MIEQLKSIIVLLVILFVTFGVGVLVGYKLPENESFKRWQSANQETIEKVRPTEVAVMQMPGSPLAQKNLSASGEVQVETHPEACPGGVCKLPLPTNAPQPPERLPEKPEEEQLNLTFYKELADKPTESGGAAIKIKSTPVVEKRKATALVVKKNVSTQTCSGDNWELRVCSLAQEIKARLVRSKLMQTYSGVEIEEVQVAGKGTWYRVKIANIHDRAVAERYQQELIKSHNYKPLIIKQ